MTGANTEGNDSKRPIAFMDVLKVVGGLAVFIPLMTGILQYRQSVQQDLDKSFRAVVEKLSSANREERLASAANMGTFIKKDGKYYNEAVDILINRIAIELDYNVLNAIRASLERVEQEDYAEVIEKSLAIDKIIFIQEYALQARRDSTKARYERSVKEFRKMTEQFKEQSSDSNKTLLDLHKKEVNLDWELYRNKKDDYNELIMHEQAITDFLSAFLVITKSSPLRKLEFFQNSMNYARMIELNLSNVRIANSAFGSSSIWGTKFDRATIVESTFGYSNLTGSSFVECHITSSLYSMANLRNVDFSKSKFKDVFFAGSDLTGTKFTSAEGLEPIYFFKANNRDKAVFDPDFKAILEQQLATVTREEVNNYVMNQAELSRADEFFAQLNKLP